MNQEKEYFRTPEMMSPHEESKYEMPSKGPSLIENRATKVLIDDFNHFLDQAAKSKDPEILNALKLTKIKFDKLEHAHLASSLDAIASEIEKEDPRIAMAIDRLSDLIEGK